MLALFHHNNDHIIMTKSCFFHKKWVHHEHVNKWSHPSSTQNMYHDTQINNIDTFFCGNRDSQVCRVVPSHIAVLLWDDSFMTNLLAPLKGVDPTCPLMQASPHATLIVSLNATLMVSLITTLVTNLMASLVRCNWIHMYTLR